MIVTKNFSLELAGISPSLDLMFLGKRNDLGLATEFLCGIQKDETILYPTIIGLTPLATKGVQSIVGHTVFEPTLVRCFESAVEEVVFAGNDSNHASHRNSP